MNVRTPAAVAALICCASWWAGGLAGAANLVDEFAAARPALQRQLRSRDAEERIKALHKLAEYPLADAVRLVCECFADADVKVRHAAYATLLVTNGEQEVCDTLVELVDKGVGGRDDAWYVPPALAALLSSPLPRVPLRGQRLLDDAVARSKLAGEIGVAMADGLGVHAQPGDVGPLVRLSKTNVFKEHFGVRRAVVEALSRIRTKESVGALIGMLDVVGGEARADAAEYLSGATHQALGTDAAAWSKWWAANGEAFVVQPKGSLSMTFRAVAEGDSGSYYGMPLFAEKLVFVIDTSGSMSGGRLMAAKRELIRAIEGLPDYAQFGVVAFNAYVGAWQKKLVPANKRMKQAAIGYVQNLNASATTASYDALEAALTFDTEAIYFLSDGAPTTGKILAPVDIVAAITTVNKVRRVSIYTIGIAPGFAGSPTDAFLSTLAQENRGQYRRVDQ